MKKKLIATVAAAAFVLSTGSVFAAEAFDKVDLDGYASLRYRSDSNSGQADKNGSIFKFVLNAKTGVAKNLDLYARLGASTVSTKGLGADFADTTKSSVASIDQVGFNYSNAGWNYKIGRQEAYLGATALLYSSLAWVGPDSMVDGVTVTGKSGVTDIKFVAAQEAYAGTTNDNKFYYLHAGYSPAKAWNLGASVARYNYQSAAAADTNIWALDAAYTTGKATIFGEYGKSNASTENKTYDVGVSYGFDKYNSGYVIYFDNGVNGDMGGRTDFENGYKGFYYGVDHKINKNTTASLFYRDMESKANSATKNTSLRATVTYKF